MQTIYGSIYKKKTFVYFYKGNKFTCICLDETSYKCAISFKCNFHPPPVFNMSHDKSLNSYFIVLINTKKKVSKELQPPPPPNKMFYSFAELKLLFERG